MQFHPCDRLSGAPNEASKSGKMDEHGRNTQMLHVWNICLNFWVIFGVNVGKYSIHGAYGICLGFSRKFMISLELIVVDHHFPMKLDNSTHSRIYILMTHADWF